MLVLLELIVNWKQALHPCDVIEIFEIICRILFKFVIVLVHLHFMAKWRSRLIVTIYVILAFNIYDPLKHLQSLLDFGHQLYIHF